MANSQLIQEMRDVAEMLKSGTYGEQRCGERITQWADVLGSPRPEKDEAEMRIRHHLWLSHGHQGIYGDDGEMQCGECAPFGACDYKRDPLDRLIAAVEQVYYTRNLAALTASAEVVSPQPTKDEGYPLVDKETGIRYRELGRRVIDGSTWVDLAHHRGEERARSVSLELFTKLFTSAAEVVSPSSLVATTDEEAVDTSSRHIFTIRADGPCSVCGRPQKDAIHGA